MAIGISFDGIGGVTTGRSISSGLQASHPSSVPGGTTVNAAGYSHSSGSFDQSLLGFTKDAFGSIVSGAKSFAGNLLGSGAKSVAGNLLGSGSSGSGSYGYGSSGDYGAPMAYSSVAPTSASLQEQYPWTMVSPVYGADPKTAMQEALANTAIERQMQDFKRAGLNPVLAAKYGGADSNFNVGQVGLSSGASGAYVPSGDSGSSGAYVSSSSDKHTSGKSNFSMQMSTKSAVAALASAGTMALTKNFALGAAAYYGTQSLLNAFVPTKRY